MFTVLLSQHMICRQSNKSGSQSWDHNKCPWKDSGM